MLHTNRRHDEAYRFIVHLSLGKSGTPQTQGYGIVDQLRQYVW